MNTRIAQLLKGAALSFTLCALSIGTALPVAESRKGHGKVEEVKAKKATGKKEKEGKKHHKLRRRLVLHKHKEKKMHGKKAMHEKGAKVMPKKGHAKGKAAHKEMHGKKVMHKNGKKEVTKGKGEAKKARKELKNVAE